MRFLSRRFLRFALCLGSAPAALGAPIWFEENTLPAAQSIEVRRVSDGSVVYAHNAEKGLMPASTLKVVTAGALLEKLGPFRSFETQFFHTGKRVGDEIRGDLVIVGDGDPLFTSEAMWQIAVDLRNQGIRSIKGNLILDNHKVPAQFREEALRKTGTHNAYDAPLSAFFVNFNTYVLNVAPGQTVGAPAFVHLDPYSLEGVEIRNSIHTGKAGAKKEIQAFRSGKSPQEVFTASGQLPLGGTASKLYRAVENPVHAAGAYVKAFLDHEGIRIHGKVQEGVKPSEAKLLLSWESRSMAELVRALLFYSNNVIADVLLQRLVAEEGSPSQSSGQFLEAYLQQKVPAAPRAQLQDGSGLDRGNAISARMLTEFLVSMGKNEKVFPDFLAAFPTAGRSGTLQSRFKNGAEKALQGLVRAKTGTLAEMPAVASLVGYMFHPKEGLLAFSLLQNATSGKSGASVESLHRVQESGLYKIYQQGSGR